MKPSESSDRVRSFKELKNLLDNKSVSLPSHSPDDIAEEPDKGTAPNPDLEKKLFKEAMSDVTRLPKATRAPGKFCGKQPAINEDDPDAEALAQLENLVEYGIGFDVSNTPEYIEGTGYRIHPTITQRLHQGEFSIQAHIDSVLPKTIVLPANITQGLRLVEHTGNLHSFLSSFQDGLGKLVIGEGISHE